jgi:hypothetical protein
MRNSFNNVWNKIKNLAVSGAQSPKTIADHNREVLVKSGRKQFEKLKDLGLSIPVALS